MAPPTDVLPLARLRAALATQVAPPLAVSAHPQQYWFGEELAAYDEIDVRDGERFALVIVRGALPDDALITEIWHRFAPEVWLVDIHARQVFRARRHQPVEILDATESLSTPHVPGVAIELAALFTAAS